MILLYEQVSVYFGKFRSSDPILTLPCCVAIIYAQIVTHADVDKNVFLPTINESENTEMKDWRRATEDKRKVGPTNYHSDTQLSELGRCGENENTQASKW